MWQRFTERARKVVFYAQEEAQKWGENSVGPEYVLLGLIHEEDNMASRVLNRLGVSLQAIREGVEAQLRPSENGSGQDMQLTPAAKRIIDFAYEEAKQLNNNYIGAEHLLLGQPHVFHPGRYFVQHGRVREERGRVGVVAQAQQHEVEAGFFIPKKRLDGRAVPRRRFGRGPGSVDGEHLRGVDAERVEQGRFGHQVIAFGRG